MGACFRGDEPQPLQVANVAWDACFWDCEALPVQYVHADSPGAFLHWLLENVDFWSVWLHRPQVRVDAVETPLNRVSVGIIIYM